jgi:hypothetical protein
MRSIELGALRRLWSWSAGLSPWQTLFAAAFVVAAAALLFRWHLRTMALRRVRVAANAYADREIALSKQRDAYVRRG